MWSFKLKIYFILFGLIILVSGCSTSSVVISRDKLPQVYRDHNKTHMKKYNIKISLFRLDNFTDTPRAGMRASSIIQGILLAKGYKVKSHITEKTPTLKKAKKIAKGDGSKYFMYGGVSEWRYKTGIDGEPAVSIQCSLYKSKNTKEVWSSIGSDSDWGNSSIGTTAQNLLEKMLN
jgi:hypothetical protein